MASNSGVQGAENLALLGRALKGMDKQLRLNLSRNLRNGAKPITQNMKSSLADGLPKGGGLASLMSSTTTVGARVTMSGKNTGVRIQAESKGHDLQGLDAGQIRHPVFGNRSTWVTQNVTPGLLSQPFMDALPSLQQTAYDAIDQTVQYVVRMRH